MLLWRAVFSATRFNLSLSTRCRWRKSKILPHLISMQIVTMDALHPSERDLENTQYQSYTICYQQVDRFSQRISTKNLTTKFIPMLLFGSLSFAVIHPPVSPKPSSSIQESLHSLFSVHNTHTLICNVYRETEERNGSRARKGSWVTS